MKGVLVHYGEEKMKKAQMKIQQMAFVLIAITLFFVLTGIFVFAFKFSGLKQSATDLEEENAFLLSTKLMNSPEFSCGESFGDTRINCVDEDKLMALKENTAYTNSNFWGASNIEVRKIYPEESEKVCNSENYPDCNTIKIYNQEVSGFDVSNFVSLCRKALSDGKVYTKCELAKIIVSYEKK
ncbi:MAG: hypothetical protein Q8P15_01200 [Nanoarchaeota archaeon]|nr:hypothetical protein [Nanoarchaeota archaeon]